MCTFVDDDGIAREDLLLRRIDADHHIIEENGVKRLSSGAFDDSSNDGAMSVALQRLLENPQNALYGYPDMFLVSFSAGFARDQQQGVERDPLDSDHAHTCMFTKNRKNRSKGVKRLLVRSCRWVVSPPFPVEGPLPPEPI